MFHTWSLPLWLPLFKVSEFEILVSSNGHQFLFLYILNWLEAISFFLLRLLEKNFNYLNLLDHRNSYHEHQYQTIKQTRKQSNKLFKLSTSSLRLGSIKVLYFRLFGILHLKPNVSPSRWVKQTLNRTTTHLQDS